MKFPVIASALAAAGICLLGTARAPAPVPGPRLRPGRGRPAPRASVTMATLQAPRVPAVLRAGS